MSLAFRACCVHHCSAAEAATADVAAAAAVGDVAGAVTAGAGIDDDSLGPIGHYCCHYYCQSFLFSVLESLRV